jgi:hypothetical protein
MFNPLVDNFNDLTDSEIENKISELSRKFFMTRNPEVQNQLAVILDMFKQEMSSRIAKKKLEDQNNQNGLDSLIKVS